MLVNFWPLQYLQFPDIEHVDVSRGRIQGGTVNMGAVRLRPHQQKGRMVGQRHPEATGGCICP